MATAIRQRVTVQPGGLVEVRSAELASRPGEQVEVLVVLPDPPADAAPAPAPAAAPALRSLASFIGAGKGLFGSAQEVDTYIRGLRDKWDR